MKKDRRSRASRFFFGIFKQSAGQTGRAWFARLDPRDRRIRYSSRIFLHSRPTSRSGIYGFGVFRRPRQIACESGRRDAAGAHTARTTTVTHRIEFHAARLRMLRAAAAVVPKRLHADSTVANRLPRCGRLPIVPHATRRVRSSGYPGGWWAERRLSPKIRHGAPETFAAGTSAYGLHNTVSSYPAHAAV